MNQIVWEAVEGYLDDSSQQNFKSIFSHTISPPEKTAIFTHASCKLHRIPNHPESPDRIGVIMNRLHETFHGHEKVVFFQPPDDEGEKFHATQAQLTDFHSPAHVANIYQWAASLTSPPNQPLGNKQKQNKHTKPHETLFHEIDEDTTMMESTLNSALVAAGLCCYAVDYLVCQKKAQHAFCVVRPPGHHAEVDQSMGFCFFNNVGIAARYALKQYKSCGIDRIAILDFDVHHGNGLENFLQSCPQEGQQLYYVSSHQEEIFPHTGQSNDVKNPNVFNLLLPKGCGSKHFRKLYQLHVIPYLKNVKANLLFFCCGFDAHKLDPLADLYLTSQDYHWVTNQIVQLAAETGSSIISALEGGYHLTAIAESAEQHVLALINEENSVDLISEKVKSIALDEKPVIRSGASTLRLVLAYKSQQKIVLLKQDERTVEALMKIAANKFHKKPKKLLTNQGIHVTPDILASLAQDTILKVV